MIKINAKKTPLQDQLGAVLAGSWEDLRPFWHRSRGHFLLIFHVFLKLFWGGRGRQGSARRGSATLGGTPCDSLKTLLEPFSVPLLGKNDIEIPI